MEADMPTQLTGTEHLMICLEVLQDFSSQLLGDPGAAIAAIRRSGELVPAPRLSAQGDSFEEREAAAGAKIAHIHKRKLQRDAVEQAVAVIQEVVREISKAPPVAQRLAV